MAVTLRTLLIAVATLFAVAGHAESSGAVAPIPPGTYAVGCSNIEQDFTRMKPGDFAEDYWTGLPRGNTTRYVTDLLVDPAHAFVVAQPLPNNAAVFGPYAGTTYPYANLVCYPTDPANPRPPYLLPLGYQVPHMQRGAEPPIFPAGSGRFPVLLYSHGMAGSPISGDYVEAVKGLASYGYVVVAPFHGDLRYANINLAGFADPAYAVLNYRTFVALQATRPLSLTSALDAVLNHPDFRDHVDADRVGGFGISLGGQSLLLMSGAGLTTTLLLGSTRVTLDPRLKAAVGYIPYFGADGFPAFGKDQAGLDGTNLPYLAISGTADTTAPISAVDKGLRRLTGTRQLVALTGLTHGTNPIFADDVNTWTQMFYSGQFNDDRVARAASARMTSVIGGGEDIERLDYMAPTPPYVGETLVIEYYNNALAHFFMTGEAAEAAMLDAGVLVPGWQRTGYAFRTFAAGSQFGLAACRFFGTPPFGPNSHFYTINAAECAKVKADVTWTYEGLAFNALAPVAGDCFSDRIPVIRLYNDGMGGQANHRFTTSRSEVRAMQSAGWTLEGPVFCAIP